MALKKYSYNNKTQLSTHFNVQEFKCKCNKKHEIYVDTKLITLLEKLIVELNASKCKIYSGYRCVDHDKTVGGSGSTNRSHKGYAVDCYFLDQNGKTIESKKVCLTLEDMGHKYGVAYRCGGASNASGKTHIDTKPRKWYGDESIREYRSKSCCTSFYTYFRISKPKPYSGTFPKLPLIGSIKKGSKGNEVKHLQEYLNWANGCKLKVDGIFGDKTETEVKKFQKSSSLTQDGKFGKKSLAAAKKFKK